jgi:arabinogalactan oligomer/maltooligosaccharide transport system permease protein
MTWNKFLSDGGLIEQIMKMFGWMNPAAHLTVMTDPTSARITVILVNVWVGIPYTILSTTGILMNVPEDLYESASIDGAGPARQYFKITLPYVLFVMGPSLITQFVGNINNFNVIYFLTGGAPTTNDYLSAGKTDLLVTWLYKLTVNQSNFAYASVIGIMIFVISAIFSLIAYRFSSSNQNEEDFA